MALLGNETESAAMEYILLRSSLWKFNQESDRNSVNNRVMNLFLL